MKQLTVLFCDIVGSTPLAERLGAEGMRDVVDRFLEISIAEIRRYGGTVPEFTGYGFMAVFGAPRAYEDHVRRALLAALGIRRALSGETETASEAGFALPVRIGIHTGPAVFGPVGGDFGMETVIGDTANVAARMQQAADPGVILLSEATWLSAQGYARTEPVEPIVVKGKTELIPGYRLIGVSRSRAVRDGPRPGHATSFVNRTEELAALVRFAEEAETGDGRVVGIVGEPGIGKSRLVDEMRQRLAHRHVNWVEAHCHSYGTMIPYQLVLDLLRSSCGIADADMPEEIAHKVRAGLRQAGMEPDQDAPLLFYLLGIKPLEDPALSSRPEAVKDKIFDIFRRLAVNGSRRRPLALVVEDLHWIDKISEEFLRFAAEWLAGARIFLIATYRPDFVPPWGGLPVAPADRAAAVGHRAQSSGRARGVGRASRQSDNRRPRR
jgi:class 3 adenylate cyclase